MMRIGDLLRRNAEQPALRDRVVAETLRSAVQWRPASIWHSAIS